MQSRGRRSVPLAFPGKVWVARAWSVRKLALRSARFRITPFFLVRFHGREHGGVFECARGKWIFDGCKGSSRGVSERCIASNIRRFSRTRWAPAFLVWQEAV